MKCSNRLNERLRELMDEIRIQFYIAEKIDFIFEQLDYPYRLFSVNDFMNKSNNIKIDKVKTTLKTEKMILDSGIFNDEITNEMILNVAKELNPTYVVPKDYLHNDNKTKKSIKNFIELMDSYISNIEPIIPLQPPWKIDNFLMKFDYFAIAGLKGYGIGRKKKIINTVVNRYKEKKFHLFGVKPTTTKNLIKNNDNILSCDTAIYKYVFNNKDVAQGKYHGLPRDYYAVYFLLNEFVLYYNHKNDDYIQSTLF